MISDLYGVTRKLLKNFRVPHSIFEDPELSRLGNLYIEDLKKNSRMLTREQRSTGTVHTESFVVKHSKPIIDKIDICLARHYGFTAEELDFIQNYDIKFRVKE